MKKLNIPTEHGELRSSDQYVVAAGSFIQTSEDEIKNEASLPEEEKQKILSEGKLGLYSVLKLKPVKTISELSELPKIFQDRFNEVQQQEREAAKLKTQTIKPTGKHSALFDLKISDVVSIYPNTRVSHPLHDSESGQNFSVSGELAHCWRHSVSLNAIQFLAVKSGFMTCLEAGTGHKGSGAGSSKATGNDGAIFWSWHEAKKSGLIPKDDPIPVRALLYIARKHGILNENADFLPLRAYAKTLKIVEEKY